MGEKLERFRQEIEPLLRRYLSDYASHLKGCRTGTKIFRDAIFGFQTVRAYEIAIIDSPLFQRLRRISQTSLAYFTYASAVHSRFEHSLNCMHLADLVLEALEKEAGGKEHSLCQPSEWAEVRLAALLHDIGHGIFSHGSEFYYSEFPGARELMGDEFFSGLPTSVAEAVNYCIITSKPFQELFSEIRRKYSAQFPYLGSIPNLSAVADMIIGRPPEGIPERRYQTDMINGPFDVDKLDYLTRDGYFTGINFSVDIDRLLPSLRVCPYKKERRLAVDPKGIAVLEQLLFGRLLLYDTVYHHHKVRAAHQNLHRLLRTHGQEKVWKTSSKQLNSLPDFLEMDEDDFFGHCYESDSVRTAVDDLKNRRLYRRALVIMPRCLANKDSYTLLSGLWGDYTNTKHPPSVKKAEDFFLSVRKAAAKYAKKVLAKKGMTISEQELIKDIIIDVPAPRGSGYKRIGIESLVEISPGLVIPLAKLFPFHKVVGNYTEQYKYRTYVFCPEEVLDEVAYAVYRSFGKNGVKLNDLALTLAHRATGKGSARELLHKNRVDVLDWEKDFYIPDMDDPNY